MEKSLDLLAQKNQFAVWQWDLNKKEVYVNASFESIFNLEAGRTVFQEKRMMVLINQFLSEGQRFSLLESLRGCKAERIPFTKGDFSTLAS